MSQPLRRVPSAPPVGQVRAKHGTAVRLFGQTALLQSVSESREAAVFAVAPRGMRG